MAMKKEALEKIGIRSDPLPEWTQVAGSSQQRSNAACVAIDRHRCLVIGGRPKGGAALAFVEVYDDRTNQWTTSEYPPLKTPRHRHQGVLCRNKVYVLGGCDNSGKFHDTIAVLNLTTKAWGEFHGAVPTKRRNAAAVAVMDRYIVVVGGYDEEWNCLHTMEIIDTATGTISKGPDITEDRCGCTAAVVENTIYVVGGYNGSWLNTAESLTFTVHTTNETTTLKLDDNWTMCPGQMPFPCERHAMTVVGKIMVVVGGYDGTSTMRTVQAHNTQTKEWVWLGYTRDSLNDHVVCTLQDTHVLVAGGCTGRYGRPGGAEILKLEVEDPLVWARRHPRLWSITYQQLMDIDEKAASFFDGDSYSDKNMHDVVEHIIKPTCRATGKPYALQLNQCGLPLDAFISHSWNEPFGAFVESIRRTYWDHDRKPNLWICSFALIQGDNEEVQGQLGNREEPLSESPFVRALKDASTFVVVRNSVEDVYDRIWCVCEVIYAKRYGFFPNKTLVAGPNDFRNSRSSCIDARSSCTSDKVRILRELLDNNEYEGIDRVIKEFRTQT